jgi:hypothetical protein
MYTYIHTYMAARLSTSALNFTHLLNTWRNWGIHLLSTRARDKQASKQRREGALGQVGLVAPYLVVVVVVWMIFYGLYSLHSTLLSSLLSLALSFSTNPFLLLHCIPIFFFNPLVSSTGFDVCLLLSLCLDWCLTIRVFFYFGFWGFFFKLFI